MNVTASTTRRGLHFVTVNGETVGSVRNAGRTFQAVRKNGQQGVDIRRVSQGFRTVEAAAAWIVKGA